MDLALNDAIHSTLHWAVLQPTSARCNLPTAHTQRLALMMEPPMETPFSVRAFHTLTQPN